MYKKLRWYRTSYDDGNNIVTTEHNACFNVTPYIGIRINIDMTGKRPVVTFFKVEEMGEYVIQKINKNIPREHIDVMYQEFMQDLHQGVKDMIVRDFDINLIVPQKRGVRQVLLQPTTRHIKPFIYFVNESGYIGASFDTELEKFDSDEYALSYMNRTYRTVFNDIDKYLDKMVVKNV